MDGFLAACLAVAFGVGAFIAALVVNTSWQQDCERLGAHLSERKVYECRVKP